MAPNAEAPPGEGRGGGRESTSSTSSNSTDGVIPSNSVLHRRTSQSGAAVRGGAVLNKATEGEGAVGGAAGAAAAAAATAAAAAAAAAAATSGPKAVQCRSCVGLALMTSNMRRQGRPAACYGLRRGVAVPPELPEVRDEYIEEVLRSEAKWTYMCLGASETLLDDEVGGTGGGTKPAAGAEAGKQQGSKAPGSLAPLPTCRGLLIFMDGEPEGEEDDDPLRRRSRRAGRGGMGAGGVGEGGGSGNGVAPERPTHIVGGIVNRRPTQNAQQQQQQQPRTPSSSPFPGGDGSPLGEAARRVGEFWSNASEDFGSKYWRASKKLLSAMDRQAHQVVITGRRMLGLGRPGAGEGEDEEGTGSGGGDGGQGGARGPPPPPPAPPSARPPASGR